MRLLHLATWSLSFAVILTASARSHAAEPPQHSGRIAGTVVHADTKEPIAGAYVGIGDFGDAGGSNLGRFRQQGNYATSKTDENGRFELTGVALGEHPLVVTHGEFVRCDKKVVARRDAAEADLRIEMSPAGKINLTMVDAEDRPLSWQVRVCLEALDGRRSIPPGKQPHLSAFASAFWKETVPKGTFSFTELAPGEYRIDAVNVRGSWTFYHGNAPRVKVKAGQTTEVRINPAGHHNAVTTEIPAPLKALPQMRSMLLFSRNLGLLAWSDDKMHHPEDPRLGRIEQNAFVVIPFRHGRNYTVKNLPPGTYAVFAGPPVCLQGAKVEVPAEGEVTTDLVWQEPKAVATVMLSRFDRRVQLPAKEHTAAELCELLSAKTESKPHFKADPAIQDVKVSLSTAESSLWEILEAVYLDKGWKIQEEGRDAVVLGPPPPPQRYSLKGKVLAQADTPVAGATVVLFEQSSGMPLTKRAMRTFTEAHRMGAPTDDLAHVLTDQEGRFRFERVPPGEYRLIAQSWPDAESVQGIMEQANGEELHLHGIAEHVKVSAEATPEVVLRPLGTGALRLDEEAGNDWTVLALSKAPTRADPALGFAGWGGPFMQNLLGGHRMPKGKTTVTGLPAGKLYIALFCNDNNPGFGAAEVEIRPGETAELSIPIVASWSNGHRDPPKRLLPLFEEVKKLMLEEDLTVISFIESQGIHFERKGPFEYWGELGQNLAREVELPTGRKTTLGDFMAAAEYVRLQQLAKQREEQWKRRDDLRNSKDLLPEANKKGSYQESIFDLYRELGENYPCFELKKIDWKAVGVELLPRAEQVKTDQQFALLCAELVARLEDSHAQLRQGTADAPVIPYPRWDPGFACLIDDRGKPVVYYVDEGGPSDRAGVKVGMTVLSVEGRPVGEVIQQCMKQTAKYMGFSSRRYLHYQAARWFVRQMEQGTTVSYKMETADGKARQFKLAATLETRYLPRLPVPTPGIVDSANVSWTMLDGNIGYIYVRRIANDLVEKLDEAVGELKDARGLIVDVRGNSGGGFDSSRAFRNFTPGDTQEPDRPRFLGPMALLIDARCISAGEGWASWFIAHNHRAQVFGQTTAGASARKKTYTLKNGLYKVTYPVKAYRGSLDRPIERRGLEPDVPLMPKLQDLAAGRDTVREAARKYLLELPQ